MDRDDNRDVNNTLPLLAIAANPNEAAKYQKFSPGNRGNSSHLFKTLSDDNRDVDFLPLFAVNAKGNEPQSEWRALTDAGLIIDVKASEVVEDKQDTAVIGDVPESQGTGDTVISRTIVEVSKNPETQLDESKLKDNLKVVFADTLQNNSELDLLEIYGIVDTALRDSYDYLSKFKFDPEYSQKLETAFGTDFNREVADNLFDNFANRNFTDIPTIKIVNRGAIAGGNGAFSDNTQKVYLAVEFVNKYANNTARITDVLIEEIGHFVDSQINEIDALGDEGDIFSELVLGNTISDEALKALKAENDKVTLVRGNNEEIGVERNNDSIRVGTWNMLRNDRGYGYDNSLGNHVDRIKYIAKVGLQNDIDIIVLQEFNSANLTGLVGTKDRDLASVDQVNTALNQLTLGYGFKFVIPEIPFNPYNNSTYRETHLNPNNNKDFADFSGYLVLYKNTITNISSIPNTYSSGPEFYKSQEWTINKVNQTNLVAGGSNIRLYQPPINFTAEKGEKTYTFFTWHNQAPGPDARKGFIQFNKLLNDDNPISNSIILGDFNIGSKFPNPWGLQNANRTRFEDYNGWQNRHDVLMASNNAVVHPIPLVQMKPIPKVGTDPLLYSTLKSDHYPIFAEINFNPSIINQVRATYIVAGNVTITNIDDSDPNHVIQLSKDNPENLQNINLEQSTADKDWFISEDYDGISRPLLFVDDANINLTKDATGKITAFNITPLSTTDAPEVYSAMGNDQESVLFKGTTNFNAETLTATITETGDSGDSGFKLIGGIEVNFDGLSFGEDADGSPQLRLQGSMLLPKNLVGGNGLLVAINGTDYLGISDNGLEVTGGFVQLPGETSFVALGLLEIKALDAQVKFDFTNEEITLQGKFTIPTLKNATFDLQGGNYIKVKRTATGLDFSMIADVGVSNIPLFGSWAIQDINLNVNTPNNNFTVNAKLKTPGSPIELTLAFNQGKITQITGTSPVGTDFTFLGAAVDIQTITTTIDRNTTDSESWDPELSLQGVIEISKLKGLKGTLTGNNKLLVNTTEAKLTGAYLELAKITATKTKQQALAEGIKLGSWTLYDVAAIYDGTQNKFTGDAKLQTAAGEDIGLTLVFDSNGLQNITASNINLSSFGAKISGATINFTPDINPADQEPWEPEFTLQGVIEIPQFNGLKGTLTGTDKLVVRKDKVYLTGAKLSTADIQLGNWKLRNIQAEFNGTTNTFAGSAILQTYTGQDIAVSLLFDSNGLQNITASNISFGLFGATVSGASINFTPDRNGGTYDWDPEFKLQGTLALPAALGGIAVSVTGNDYLLVNNNGFDLTGGRIYKEILDFNLGGLLRVQGRQISLQYTNVNNEKVFTIQGRITLPDLYNLTGDFSGSNYIKINTNGAVEVVGSVSANNINIAPGWTIKNAAVSFNTTNNQTKVNANATVTIPSGIDVAATVLWNDSQLQYIQIGASNLNKPIGATGAFLQDINGSYSIGQKTITVLGQQQTYNDVFQGNVKITAGPRVNLNNLPDFLGGPINESLVNVDVTATITPNFLNAQGNVRVLGGLITGTGEVNLNWQNNSFGANANLNFLKGLLQADAKLVARGRDGGTKLDFYAYAEGTVNIPNPIPTIGGFTLGGGGAYFQYIHDDNSNNDYVAAWGKLVGWTVGVKFGFDGSVSLIGSELPEKAKANINNLWANLNNPYTAPAALDLSPNLPPKGSNGNDIINGNDNLEFIDGVGGNDVLNGKGGDDILDGGDGNDILNGGTGKDVLNGGADNDTLIGRTGDDTYIFDADNAQGADTINETIIALKTFHNNYAQATQTFWNIQQQAGALTDETKFTVINNGDGTIALSTHYDRFWAADGVNITSSENIGTWERFRLINHSDGKISLQSGYRNTYVRANTTTIADARWNIDQSPYLDAWEKFTVIKQDNNSTDTLDFSATTTRSINLDLSIAGQQTINENLKLTLGITLAGVSYIDVENAVGGSLNDTLKGNNLNNVLRGKDGNDILIGAEGSDSLMGGDGDDTIDGDTAHWVSDVARDTIYGGAGNDFIWGGEDNDFINGETGNDTLIGESGNDTLIGAEGSDSLMGGDGDDTIDGDTAHWVSDVARDTIYGGAGNDFIWGGEDNDFINGETGNDTLIGESGNDTLNGGDGNDTVYGGWEANPNGDSANDELWGGAGNDLLDGEQGNDWLSGEWGRDTVRGGDGNDTVFGGWEENPNGDSANDELWGGAGNDLLDGEQGNDWLSGESGRDTVRGGDGNDTVYGGWEANPIGDSANDELWGGAGNDLLGGEQGNDTLIGGLGNDTLDGGLGEDTADYSSSTGGINVTLGAQGYASNDGFGTRDTLMGIDHVTGSAYNDIIVGDELWNNTLRGNDGNDTLSGLGGNDTLWGGAGNDFLDGGQGNDWLTGEWGRDTVRGGDGDDVVLGGLELNPIGDSANDELWGGAGNDFLDGEQGNDWLTGDAGADRFSFRSVLNGIDTITDFSRSQGDKIEIVQSFGATSITQFSYNNLTGALSFNNTHFATLLNPTNSNFIVSQDIILV